MHFIYSLSLSLWSCPAYDMASHQEASVLHYIHSPDMTCVWIAGRPTVDIVGFCGEVNLLSLWISHGLTGVPFCHESNAKHFADVRIMFVFVPFCQLPSLSLSRMTIGISYTAQCHESARSLPFGMQSGQSFMFSGISPGAQETDVTPPPTCNTHIPLGKSPYTIVTVVSVW